MHTVLSQKENFIGNKLKTFLRKILYKMQNKVISNLSDIIIVHANFFKEILVKEYGIQSSKVLVIPQGIITDLKITNKRKAKERLKLFGNVYLIIGNFVPDHGTDIILKEAREIGKTILIVASPNVVNYKKQKRSPSYLNKCIQYVCDNNISEDIRFDIAHINDTGPKWWLYFSAADLVLQPYRGGVGSGIFTHAMAAQKPVISSSIPFFKEISRKYGCLKMAKKNSDYPRIIKEAMKGTNYQKMVMECKRYAKENSWDEIAKKYKEVYSTLK